MPGGENGTIMKKSDNKERRALRALMDDTLKDFVPEYKGEVEHDGNSIFYNTFCSIHVWVKGGVVHFYAIAW